MRMRRGVFASIITALLLAAGLSAGLAIAGEPDWLKAQEQTVDQYQTQMLNAVPYPVSQMRDSLERRNIRERLLRFNKPDKVGYLYLMSFGKFVGYYVVKGKVSSVNSQMTPDQKAWHQDGGIVIVNSPGDDGSYGPNEGGDAGTFFFTAQGVMVETTLDWVYSDTPLNVDVPNLLKK